nr:uncharacterized mitochondrial protein AtMg00810-like [Tanacetum cinerariifolium]
MLEHKGDGGVIKSGRGDGGAIKFAGFNIIHETDKEKTLVFATLLTTAFLCTSIVQYFQDSPNNKEDKRSSQEYMNDLEEEYQARAFLAKSKRFLKRGLIAETYEWDEEEVSSDENEAIEVKALMALANEERVIVSKENASNGELVKISIQKCISEQIPTQKKKILGIDQLTEETSNSGLKDLVFVKSSGDNSEVSITGSNKPNLSEAEDSTLSKHDTSNVPSNESQRNINDHSVIVSDSSATDYDSADESGNKSSSASKTNSALAGKLKNVKMEDDPPLAIVMKELNELKLQINKNKSSYSRNKNTQQRYFNQPRKICQGSAKKYDIKGSSVKTPMVPPNKLGPDLNGKAIKETQYKGMIRSLMYLTTSRPDIQFSTCLCARHQSNPKESHLIAVKRIFRYLKDTPSLGLWYPNCSSFDQKGYSDSDYAGCNIDKKSTSSACQLLGGKLVCWSAKKQQYDVIS